jgi:hypothetical protein
MAEWSSEHLSLSVAPRFSRSVPAWSTAKPYTRGHSKFRVTLRAPKLIPMNSTSYANEPTILLVKDGAELPPDLPTETAAFLPGWRVVRNFDNYALHQKIRGTNWSFLPLRGGKETTVMGRSRQKILRRGVAQILTQLTGRKFNSVEITVLSSKSFLGLLSLNMAVNLRHFQYSSAVAWRGG